MWCSAVVLGLLIFQVAVIHLRPFFLPEAVLVVLKNGGASLYSNGIWQRSMQLLITVLLTPLTEEAFFRGILMTRWATKTGSLWWSALASSTAFAVLHFHPIDSFVFGLAMAALYVRFNSLWLPIAAHVFANGYAFAGGFPYWMIESSIGDPSDLMFGVACLLISVPFLAWFFWRSRSAFLGEAPYLKPNDASVTCVSPAR
jgi:membrane protease YdiL (CAAX protease family)